MKTQLRLLFLLLAAGMLFTTNQANAQKLYDIATVTTEDANGEPDSIDVICKVKGIVYGVNMSSSSRYDFTIIDGTGGIKVFNFSTFTYVPMEGDEVEVTGKISFFRGLTQIGSLDTVIKLSDGNSLKKPKVVTKLDESTESDYIKMEGVWLVNPLTTFSTGNANLDITNGTDTFTMRVDTDTDIGGLAAPSGRFDVTGIGGQFDFSAPFDEGYQIFPSRHSDLDTAPYQPRPDYKIGTVTTLDGDGSPDSLGVKCRVTGIVYGINYRPGGLTFTIIDETGGMGVFENSKDLGYTVTEGDSIMVQGEVAFFRGLTQMGSLDSVVKLSDGHTLMAPKVVTMLDETTESMLVQLQKLWTVDGDTAWPENGNIDMTNGTDTFTIRVDRDVTDVSAKKIMYDTMNITGLGGQFDFSAPYDMGYQLFPRYADDIEEYKTPVSVVNTSLVRSKVYPNPSNGQVTVLADAIIEAYTISDLQGRIIRAAQFSEKGSQLSLDLNEFKSGMYSLDVYTDKGVAHHKIVLR